jgi:hypothetical protein
VKGETVHAIFAEIEQQRAKRDHDGLQRHGAEQPGQRFGRHAQQQRRDTTVTNEYEKHCRRLFWYRLHPFGNSSEDVWSTPKIACCLFSLYPMRFSLTSAVGSTNCRFRRGAGLGPRSSVF